MANISEMFGTFVVENYNCPKEKVEDFLIALDSITGQWCYYFSLFTDSMDCDRKGNFTGECSGNGRWTMENTLENVTSETEIIKLTDEFFDEDEYIVLKVKYNDYEPGCEYLVVEKEVEFKFMKKGSTFEVIEEGRHLRPTKSNLMEYMLYDSDYWDDEENEEEDYWDKNDDDDYKDSYDDYIPDDDWQEVD